MLPACSRVVADALPASWRWAGLIAIPLCLTPTVASSGPWALCWFCNATLIVTWLGLLLPSQRLLSATLPASLSINAVWTVDALSTLAGTPLSGMTSYVTDPTVSLGLRCATWFHAIHPLAMFLVMRRIGYHPHGLRLAVAEMAGIILVLRLCLHLGLAPDSFNWNWMQGEPSWGMPPWFVGLPYNLLQIVFLAVGLILPVHLMLRIICPIPAAAGARQAEGVIDGA